jgi:hypothetical protein
MLDDNRPIVTFTYPVAGRNKQLGRIVFGLHDYDTGLDAKSLSVVADFEIAGIATGENLAKHFKPASQGVWQWKLPKPITKLATGTLTIRVRDHQGNETRVARTFSCGEK